eukprot:751456-Prymnesium_polylepis.1
MAVFAVVVRPHVALARAGLQPQRSASHRGAHTPGQSDATHRDAQPECIGDATAAMDSGGLSDATTTQGPPAATATTTAFELPRRQRNRLGAAAEPRGRGSSAGRGLRRPLVIEFGRDAGRRAVALGELRLE